MRKNENYAGVTKLVSLCTKNGRFCRFRAQHHQRFPVLPRQIFQLVICHPSLVRSVVPKGGASDPGIVMLVDGPLVGWILGNSAFWSMVFKNLCRASEEGYNAMHMELLVE